MSATNATTYYELPVFIATDKPAWLTDWNGAMSAIDTAIKEALTAGENAQTTANTVTSSIATINDSLTTINTSLTTLTSTVTGLTGSVNTINSLIGNGEPTTSDKTLIGAINEIYAMIGGGTEVDADIVAYDNTTSGLTATNVQSAIDELATASPVETYDFDLSAHTGTGTLTSSFTVNGTVNYLLNQDKSIGKIYGGIQITIPSLTTGENVVANIAIADLPTLTASYDISMGYATLFALTNVTFDLFAPVKFRFKTNNSIDVVLNNISATARTNVTVTINLAPCVLFLENLGD